MGLGTALSTVEEVGLDVVHDGEEGAARRVGRGVLAIGAGDAAGDGTCRMQVDFVNHCRTNRKK